MKNLARNQLAFPCQVKARCLNLLAAGDLCTEAKSLGTPEAAHRGAGGDGNG